MLLLSRILLNIIQESCANIDLTLDERLLTPRLLLRAELLDFLDVVFLKHFLESHLVSFVLRV